MQFSFRATPVNLENILLNKPSTERQTLHDLTHIESKNLTFRKQKEQEWSPEAGGRRRNRRDWGWKQSYSELGGTHSRVPFHSCVTLVRTLLCIFQKKLEGNNFERFHHKEIIPV